jgi:hypothetical protein
MTNNLNRTIDNVHEFVSVVIPDTITSFVNGQGLSIRSVDSQIIDNIEMQFVNRTPISGQPICTVQRSTPDEIESATQLSHDPFIVSPSFITHRKGADC